MPPDTAETSAAPEQSSESTSTESVGSDAAPAVARQPLRSVDTAPAAQPAAAPPTPMAPETPEFFDYIHGENTYQLPGALQGVIKSAGDMEKDYRNKTMSIADERRAFETERTQYQERQQIESGNSQLVQEGRQLAQFLKEYQNVDWDAYDEQNPAASQKLERSMGRKQARLMEIQRSIQANQTSTMQGHAAELAKEKAAFESELPLKIAGWNSDMRAQTAAFAENYGYSAEDVDAVTDVRAMQILNDARLGKATREATAVPTSASPRAEPVSHPSHNSNNVPSSRITGKETPNEYRRKRMQQQANARDAMGKFTRR